MEHCAMDLASKIWILLFWVIVFCGGTTSNSKLRKPSFFQRHYDTIPTLYYQGHVINSTLTPDGQHHREKLTVELRAFGKLFTLHLTLNRNLFTSTYVEKVYHTKGRSAETNHISQLKTEEHCYYHGVVANFPQSQAAFSTCHGLSGYFTDRQETYHVEPQASKRVRVYRGRDQRKLPFKCGTEGHDHRMHSHHTVMSRNKRSIRAPYDSNRNTRYVELYLVNDQRTYRRHGKQLEVVKHRSKEIANIVSSLYRQLNIYVALVGVEVWTSIDRASVTTSASKTMENFLRYRQERINPVHHNDNAQLITGVVFDDGVVGKAIKGPICTHRFSGGVNMDYGGHVTLVATTVAHEMGHNFGMEHDNDTMCECHNDKCIMAATSGQISPRHWSSCSQNSLAEAFNLGMDYCLRNLPTYIFEGPVCGNGFKEAFEECDCGLPQDCTDRCCDPKTCRLHASAECGTGRCCDLNKCRLKIASTLCREPVSECDLAEYCNGESEYCPSDNYLQDGQLCKTGKSYCYKGRCNTHTDQCKLLWGHTGRVSDPICFQQLNMNGDVDGSCGYNWTLNNYKRCDRENVMCGLLHCVHLNEKLMFWRDNLAIEMRASFLSRGNNQYVCRSAMLDVGLDMPDPGFVPDGAKCEENKICINHKCVHIAKLNVKECPENCHKHGVCNSNDNCHCDIGYAPPFCNRPGYGGSVDSGPATNEYDTNGKGQVTPNSRQPDVDTSGKGQVTPNSRRPDVDASGRVTVTPIRPGTSVTPGDGVPDKTDVDPESSGREKGAPDEEAKKNLLIALLVVFLLVVPFVILVVIAYINRDRFFMWCKMLPDLKYRITKKKRNPKAPPPTPQPNPSLPRQEFDPPKYQNTIVPPPQHAPGKVFIHKAAMWSQGTTEPFHSSRPPAPARPNSLVKPPSKPGQKRVTLSVPVQETGGPQSPTDIEHMPVGPVVTSLTASGEGISNVSSDALNGEIPGTAKSGSNIVKRDSFRGSKISQPVLMSTTNRNSVILADRQVDIIGPEARKKGADTPSGQHKGNTIHRSHSERAVQPPFSGEEAHGGTLKKSASTRSPTSPVGDGFSSLRRPPRALPYPTAPSTSEEESMHAYSNEMGMGDLLDVIKGAFQDGHVYNNLMASDQSLPSPIQETTTSSTEPLVQESELVAATATDPLLAKPSGHDASFPHSGRNSNKTPARPGNTPSNSTRPKSSTNRNASLANTSSPPSAASQAKGMQLAARTSSVGSSNQDTNNSGSNQFANELRSRVLNKSGNSGKPAAPVKMGKDIQSSSSPANKSAREGMGKPRATTAMKPAKAVGEPIHKSASSPTTSLPQRQFSPPRRVGSYPGHTGLKKTTQPKPAAKTPSVRAKPTSPTSLAKVSSSSKVSNLAARFDQSPDEKTASQSSDTQQNLIPEMQRNASLKSSSNKPAGTRPALPPKPGEAGKSAGTGLCSGPKKVHSFRV